MDLKNIKDKKNYRENLIYDRLAIHGGKKVRDKNFPAYKTIGKEEKEAVLRVLDSEVLSQFLGCWHKNFYGGPEVKALEKEWAAYFGVKHAIAVNSATSGLYTAVGALGLNPGEEVIVSPYTMTASSVAPLVYNAVPVFADIEEDYYCLDPQSVEMSITERTRAIVVVDICGQPYDADVINEIAKKHNLMVIEDCAQAPGARYKGKLAGTLGDIGVYSLNYHKHIHCGEGGIIVTNNDELAEKMRMIRNHAEAVVDGRNYNADVGLIGFNYRMTETEAAIAREQLKKLSGLVEQRVKNVVYLEEKLSTIPCLRMPEVRKNCTHVYYIHNIQFDSQIAGVHRDLFLNAVKAELPSIEKRETEGVRIASGAKPLYFQPIYQKRQAYGTSNYPWGDSSNVSYSKGICPVAEKMYEEVMFLHELMRPGMSPQDLDDVFFAFKKVWDKRDQLT